MSSKDRQGTTIKVVNDVRHMMPNTPFPHVRVVRSSGLHEHDPIIYHRLFAKMRTLDNPQSRRVYRLYSIPIIFFQFRKMDVAFQTSQAPDLCVWRCQTARYNTRHTTASQAQFRWLGGCAATYCGWFAANRELRRRYLGKEGGACTHLRGSRWGPRGCARQRNV